jgi:hypothetical protein
MKQETLDEAADKWVFETNGHKWSNNDDTAGDNYGSFIAGVKFQQDKQDEFAIGFAEWLNGLDINDEVLQKHISTKELLEIYKREV